MKIRGFFLFGAGLLFSATTAGPVANAQDAPSVDGNGAAAKPQIVDHPDPLKRRLSDSERIRQQKDLHKEIKSDYRKWLEQDVIWIITSEELQAFKQLSNDEERDAFIEAFWQRRNPNPDSPDNEYREEHYQRIAYANEHFAAGKPGWKTDRGRIYAKNGAAMSVWRRAQIQRAPPFEVWNYQEKGQGRWYIFADRTGVGDWRLLVSSDLKEPKQPDWRNILTEDGVREAGRFLNVDFYSSTAAAY